MRKTIVFVTHDIDEAVKLGDRIVILGEDGTGCSSTPRRGLLANPASPFVESFVGADRGLKLLAVTPLKPDQLAAAEPADHAPDAARVAYPGTIKDALAAMVLRRVDRVTVVGADGTVVGVFTVDALATLDAEP